MGNAIFCVFVDALENELPMERVNNVVKWLASEHIS